MRKSLVPEEDVFMAGDNRAVSLENPVIVLVKRNRSAGGVVF